MVSDLRAVGGMVTSTVKLKYEINIKLRSNCMISFHAEREKNAFYRHSRKNFRNFRPQKFRLFKM